MPPSFRSLAAMTHTPQSGRCSAGSEGGRAVGYSSRATAFTCCDRESSPGARRSPRTRRPPPARRSTRMCVAIPDTSSPRGSRSRLPGCFSTREGSPMQISSQRVHSGRVINLDIDTVRFPDGSPGQLEIIRHPGAAAVVPFACDPHGPDPTVLLIEQYRYAANGSLIEVPAGRLNPGEDPQVCAHRELLEEVGVTAGRLERLTTIWTTPGFTDERIHLFWASELKADQHAREPDEFIEVVPKPLSEALRLVQSGVITDAKTALSLLFVAGFILEH